MLHMKYNPSSVSHVEYVAFSGRNPINSRIILEIIRFGRSPRPFCMISRLETQPKLRKRLHKIIWEMQPRCISQPKMAGTYLFSQIWAKAVLRWPVSREVLCLWHCISSIFIEEDICYNYAEVRSVRGDCMVRESTTKKWYYLITIIFRCIMF